MAGVSAAFYTGVETTVLDQLEALVKEESALHFVIQHSGKLTKATIYCVLTSLLFQALSLYLNKLLLSVIY